MKELNLTEEGFCIFMKNYHESISLNFCSSSYLNIRGWMDLAEKGDILINKEYKLTVSVEERGTKTGKEISSKLLFYTEKVDDYISRLMVKEINE